MVIGINTITVANSLNNSEHAIVGYIKQFTGHKFRIGNSKK